MARGKLGGAFLQHKKWAANFSLPNNIQAYPQYKYIKGTQNTEMRELLTQPTLDRRQAASTNQPNKQNVSFSLAKA